MSITQLVECLTDNWKVLSLNLIVRIIMCTNGGMEDAIGSNLIAHKSMWVQVSLCTPYADVAQLEEAHDLGSC